MAIKLEKANIMSKKKKEKSKKNIHKVKTIQQFMNKKFVDKSEKYNATESFFTFDSKEIIFISFI
jgi:hypothetical protein